MDIELLWSDISDEISREGVRVADMKLLASGKQTKWGEILLGVDSKGCRHLVVPAPEAARQEEDSSSRGIHLEVRPYLVAGDRRLFCDVTCRLEELNNMFGAVALDMMNELEDDAGDSPFPVCLRVIERWRQLLERLPTKGLSRNAQAGLVGELLLLSQLAEHSLRAVDAWVGPAGGRHDFVSESLDIEVKTTLSAEGRRVHVQSLDQLEIAEGAELYLHFVRLREPVGQGVSLPELVEQLLRKGLNAVQLHKRLAEVGYSPVDREAYGRTRFEVVERLTFHVSHEAFPRLTRASLSGEVPRGVRAISYAVDLEIVDVAPLPEHEFMDILEGLVS